MKANHVKNRALFSFSLFSKYFQKSHFVTWSCKRVQTFFLLETRQQGWHLPYSQKVHKTNAVFLGVNCIYSEKLLKIQIFLRKGLEKPHFVPLVKL